MRCAPCPTGAVPLSVHGRAADTSPRQEQDQRGKEGFCFLGHRGKVKRVTCLRPPSPPRGPDVCALQLSAETPTAPPRVSVWSAWWVDCTAEHCARCSPTGQGHTAGQAEARKVTSLPRRSALCLFEVLRAGDAHCSPTEAIYPEAEKFSFGALYLQPWELESVLGGGTTLPRKHFQIGTSVRPSITSRSHRKGPAFPSCSPLW